MEAHGQKDRALVGIHGVSMSTALVCVVEEGRAPDDVEDREQLQQQQRASQYI
jgi:hypothetical protein